MYHNLKKSLFYIFFFIFLFNQTAFANEYFDVAIYLFNLHNNMKIINVQLKKYMS